MKKQLSQNLPLVFFWSFALAIFFARFFGQQTLGLFLTPFLTLSLIYDYHKKIGANQALYFIFLFCMLGDMMVFSNDFFSYTSGLIAYWGAAILMNFTLNRELTIAFDKAIKKPIFYIPFTIYGLYWIVIMAFIQPFSGILFIPILIYSFTLSLTCAMSIGVYLHKKTKANYAFSLGLILLSITASIMGINRFYLESNVVYSVEILLYAPTLFLINQFFKIKPNDEL